MAGSSDSTVQNCVALNNEISGNGGATGRVLYWAGVGTLSNNYGRSPVNTGSGSLIMKDSGSDYTPTSDVNGKDGADITSANWLNASWWQNTAQFSPTVWTLENGSLPVLK